MMGLETKLVPVLPVPRPALILLCFSFVYLYAKHTAIFMSVKKSSKTKAKQKRRQDKYTSSKSTDPRAILAI